MLSKQCEGIQGSPMIRTYSELVCLDSFRDRYEYLRLDGNVGYETFGSARFLNQEFYHSREWRRLRNQIILRDNACDLAMPGYDIPDNVQLIIHHINPLTEDDICAWNADKLFNPENLVCVSHDTHNAIHYGDDSFLLTRFVERAPGDTRLW